MPNGNLKLMNADGKATFKFKVYKNHLGSLINWRFQGPLLKNTNGILGSDSHESKSLLSSWGDSDIGSFRPALRKFRSSHWALVKMLVWVCKVWINVSRQSKITNDKPENLPNFTSLYFGQD